MSFGERKSPPARTGGPSEAVRANAEAVYRISGFRHSPCNVATDVALNARAVAFHGRDERTWLYHGKRGAILYLLACKPEGVTQRTTYPWCMRLASHIHVLRDDGLEIRTVREGECRHARYFLETPGAIVQRVSS